MKFQVIELNNFKKATHGAHKILWKNQTTHQVPINPLGTEIAVFRENYVDNMSTDALAPCIARASVAMVLTLFYQGKNCNYHHNIEKNNQIYKNSCYPK